MSCTFEGEIQVILGPMFSGKTSELMRRIRRYSFHKRVIVIKSSKDSRDDLAICTHNDTKMNAISADTITEVLENVDLDVVDVVAIDEGQFFSDIIEMSEHLADIGKIVIVAALSGDFKRKDFDPPCGCISKFLSIAEKIDKLFADCKCGKDGNFSRRITDEQEDVVIGGEDKYEAVCRKCYNS